MAKPKGLKEKYRPLRGKSFRKQDLKDWTEHMFTEYFRLVHFFTVEGEIKFTDLAVKSFQQHAPEHPLWEELMWRWEANDEVGNLRQFQNRFLYLTRTIGQYLQENNYLISKEMKGMMTANKYLEKYTEPFTVKTTETGIDVVTPNTDDLNDFTLPEVQYHKAIMNLSSLAKNLLEGIKADDIKKLPLKDRVELANKIINTISKIQGGHKPNTQVFKQLVIQNAGREELERAMVEMAKPQ